MEHLAGEINTRTSGETALPSGGGREKVLWGKYGNAEMPKKLVGVWKWGSHIKLASSCGFANAKANYN